jgi:RNA polymerase sigma-70 factor (ECF subfamily)
MKDSFGDEKLLRLMKEGDRESFKIIYQRYWHLLYQASYRRLANHDQSEDIAQEIFITLWERRRQLNITHLSAYLHTAVRYRVFNYVARDMAAGSFYQPFEDIVLASGEADTHLIEKELLQLADAYIAAMPRKRRQIYELYFNRNLSTREIAALMKISQKTVQNQLGNAINGLKSKVLPVCISLILLSASL